MGNGIAHVCALAGLPVAMLDANPQALDKAMATIGKNLDRQVSRSLITDEERDAALGRIATGTDYAMFGDCNLVIESATENEAIKHKILSALVPHIGADLPARLQHLVDLHHPPRRRHRPAGEIHRHALLESGAGDEAGGE